MGDARWDEALRLAIVKVRYHRVPHKVDTYGTEPNSVQMVANKLHADINLVLDGMLKSFSDGRLIRLCWSTSTSPSSNSRDYHLKLAVRVDYTLSILARKALGPAARPIVVKTKILETNSIYKYKESARKRL